MDVLDALKTLGPLQAEGRIIPFRGKDVDSLLSWTFSELDGAENAACANDEERHATQVVAHAKSALDCLLDAYLERDYLDVHLGNRAQFARKIELLKRRLGPQLPWRLINAVIASPRNVAEHERVAPTVTQAGVAAEAAKVVANAMMSSSNPLHGPALAGSFPGGFMSGEWGSHVYVESFPPSFGWIWRCSDNIPRVGIGVRVVGTKNEAEVRYAELKQFSLDEHFAMLTRWDAFRHRSWTSENGLAEKIACAGLASPAT